VSENITRTLADLAIAIRKAIQEGKLSGEFQPENELTFSWKLDHFQYTDNGLTDTRAHGDYLTRQSWFRASGKALERLKQTDAYSNTLEQLRKEFGNEEKRARDLENFANKVIRVYFSESQNADAQINSVITNFIKNLKGEPVRYGAEAELDGIILRPEEIELDFGITLRRPRIQDLEKETPAFFPALRQPFLPHPSAYLRIEFLGRAARDTQIKVQHAITILRLFRVGSVTCPSCSMYSDSVTDTMAGGTLTAGGRELALEKYLVTIEDVTKLKKFWETIASHLPSELFEFDQTKADHLTIAYTRYNDALLQNGVIEKRIANTIMGMESLYLKRSETQELAYRLGLRVGKVFRILGFEHREVKKNIADAYRIRNLFAHGSQLSYKEKRKLELRYKDLKNLLLTVLDYLRISIIAAVILRKGKDELIDLVDDSLIDDQMEELLSSWFSGTKELIR
jgi:hypothetical protein